MNREILHVNTDDFYASALRLKDPRLRSKAVVVSGPAPRGMVVSASYEARGEGVRRGMTVSSAMRLCPGGVFIPPDWDLFRSVSRSIFSVIRRYSPVVESVSLDEGYVDYTGCRRLFGRALDAGRTIKREVRAETGLDVSLGIATSKLVSHVASREAKRAHMVDVYPGCERYFLSPVPIERFPVVGERHVPLLRELGIASVGDVLHFDEELLAFCFGSWGRRLHRGAKGLDAARVRGGSGGAYGEDPDGGFAAVRVLEPDAVDRRLLESYLYVLAEELGGRLRAERSLASLLRLELRYADEVVSHGQMKPAAPTSDDAMLFDTAGYLFDRIFGRRVRVRSVSLAAPSVEPEPLQLDLFPDPSKRGAQKARRVQSALDRLRAAMPAGVAPTFGRGLAASRAAMRTAAGH
jgi:DNA polymerase-4